MKKAIFSGIVIFLLGMAFIAFNFYASRKAKDQINKFFTEQVNVPLSPVNIHYSDVNVPEFGGTIQFSNVIIQGYGRSVKIDHLVFKLGYFKLFRFFVSKMKKALQHTRSVDIQARQIQLTNDNNQSDFAIASVDIHQSGNLWDATKSIFLGMPLQQQQSFKLRAFHLQYQKPGKTLGIIKSDSAYVRYIIPGMTREAPGVQDSLLFSDVTWMLPASLKKQYGMFLAGFGFSSDSLQVNRAGFAFNSLTQKQINIKNGIFETAPLTLSFNGTVIKKDPWDSSKLAPITLKIEHLSDDLKNLLTGFGFIKEGEQQTFKLTGPIRSPHLEK